MLNYIWFGLMAAAIVVAAIKGTPDAVTKGAVESATTAVQIAIGLVGIMTLWLGMMRVAEAAGLVTLVGRALKPVLRWLFPDVPPDHPAGGAIVLALAANMLGLNNAATPLGIKAMEELQTLNPDKDTATNSMVTLMTVTTAGVQLIPASMIGVLAAAGSTNPTSIIGPTIVATAFGTVAGVIAARALQRFYPSTPSTPLAPSAPAAPPPSPPPMSTPPSAPTASASTPASASSASAPSAFATPPASAAPRFASPDGDAAEAGGVAAGGDGHGDVNGVRS